MTVISTGTGLAVRFAVSLGVKNANAVALLSIVAALGVGLALSVASERFAAVKILFTAPKFTKSEPQRPATAFQIKVAGLPMEPFHVAY